MLLSPKLDEFDRQSSPEMKADQLVEDMFCPLCRASLIEPEAHCGECNSPAARIMISVRSKLIPFYLCTKAGCRWHGISKADELKIKSKVARQKVPEQDSVLRIRNFQEVPTVLPGKRPWSRPTAA